jgi:hypothetical protein
MKHCLTRVALGIAFLLLGLIYPPDLRADPSRYPKYAQQQLPKGVVPDFIYLNQLTDEIASGKKPLIVDVRPREEYREAHIMGSSSIPLDEIPDHLAEIPKNRLVVFY